MKVTVFLGRTNFLCLLFFLVDILNELVSIIKIGIT